MTNIVTAENGIEFEVCSLGISIVDHDEQWKGWARLSPVQRRALADALAPERAEKAPAGGQWTREDFARLDIHPMSTPTTVLDEVAAWLNAHHPRPPHPMGPEVATLRRERDEANARADAARAMYAHEARNRVEAVNRAARAEWAEAEMEHERDAAVARAEQLRDERDDAVQSCMAVGRERDEWKARAEKAENARDTVATRAEQLEKALAGSRDAHQRSADAHMEWKERALLAEDRLAEYRPAVSRADIEKAVRRYIPNPHFSEPIADEVCALFGVEAEQAVDPVEEKARELCAVAYPAHEWGNAPWDVAEHYEGIEAAFRRLACHQLGQEATR